MRYFAFWLSLFIFGACTGSPKDTRPDLRTLSWPRIEKQAGGTTVYMMMWQGDPLINRYMAEYITPTVKERYGINLQIAPGQGTEIVKTLLAEKEAGRQASSIDLCWINGETFYQLRQIEALYGPFTDLLPNAQYIDFGNPFIGYDFQQKVDGYECPWGNVQLAVIYDTTRTPEPPRTLEALGQYVRKHPGKFTIPYEFTGMTLLKSWMIALAGNPDALNGPFDETKYAQLSGQLWDFINQNKAYFWRNGNTFPESLAATHQMFANGELDFTFSNNDSEVDNKILQNIFPATARAYVFDSGTIQNSHFLGIPATATNKAGALAVLNFMISPEAQLEKMQPAVWGDGTVLDLEKLPAKWRNRFENTPGRRYAPRRQEINEKALQEPAPEYMIRLYRDFREQVIEN
ncbi:MAG: ABC transporter substrate-binding protein [Bacteroidetes bacterium]|nr:MAG: ABC transporter substrate-binding protein [Bacteroidota bacterium]